jgi:glycosyltransferase involved in cell wall biosynthesis
MEAMASGLPIVSTPIGGVPEMVVNNQTGFLVPPGDPAALADATEKLIVDFPLAQKFGHSGCERAQQLFSIEKNVGELLALLRG